MVAAYERTVEPHAPFHDPAGEDPIIGVVPVGGGIWWWGDAEQVPYGWAIVDGTFAVNGSTPPDMRDKMPIAAGTTYSLGDTGGSSTQADHTGHGAHGDHSDHTGHGAHGDHSDHTGHGAHGDHTSHDTHKHGIDQDTGHQHTVSTDGDHRHTAANGEGTQAGTDFNAWQQDTSPQSSLDGDHNHGGSTGSGGTHNHGGVSHTVDPTTPTTHSAHTSNGAISAHSAHTNNGAISAHSAHTNNGAISAHGTNLPPYVAWHFIVRVF